MYVARYSDDIEGDIKRGWSGHFGSTYNSEEEAADEGVEVAYDEAIGKFRPFHHIGLSCWKLEAENTDGAIAEATRRANNDRSQGEEPIQWGGFGYVTCGTVKLVASFTAEDGLPVHVLECESTAQE